jgi:dienelactone hydrolase
VVRAASVRRAAANGGLAALAFAALAGCGSSAKAPRTHTPAVAPPHVHNEQPVVGRGPIATRGRHPIATTRLSVGRDGLYGEWDAPRDSRRRMPAVVTFGGSGGGLTTTPLSRALASAGYPSLALAYFKEPGLPRHLRKIPLEYFARAVRFSQRQPGVDPGRVVVMGHSRGGEAALLIAATYPQLVHGAIGLVPHYETGGGWTLHGKLLPFDMEIPVERINGPVLTASGGRDHIWSSSVYTDQIELRLQSKGFRYPHERLDFPQAGHSLRGTGPVLWPRILRLLRRLAAAPPAPAHAS